MVRLKVPPIIGYSHVCEVSIPVWYDWKCPAVSPKFFYQMFQFQYGTIERFGKSGTANLLHVSIPVWYDWKPCLRIASAVILCFNSSMVRLKVFSASNTLCKCRCFNSSMVRLKASAPINSIFSTNSFQFQYGTIESSVDTGLWVSCWVSIPVWYDWKTQ